MFDPFTLALISGAVGGLMNKKDPLKGALLGAGLGYGGGLLAPAAAGAGVTGAAAEGVGAMSVPGAVGGMSVPAETGLLGSAANPAFAIQEPSLLGSATGMLKEAKPFMEAGSTAMQVANLTKGQPQAPIQPSPITPPMPNTASGNMVANMQQQQAERMAREKQLRLQRQQMRGMA